MKFYHLADIHLGAEPDRGMPWSKARAQELYKSFYNVLDRAKVEQVDLVLISGDLFHRQPLKRELKEINYHFGKIAPVQVVIIAGNHDYIKKDSNYVNFPWNDNVCFITDALCRSVYFENLNTCVYGLSYHNYEITAGLYDGMKPQRRAEGSTHILLAHGGDEKHIPIAWQALNSAGFDYVALGHIHRPQIFKSRRMAYAGALEPIDKNDEGPHGFIEGICENHQTSIRFVPWAKRSYVNMDVAVKPQMSWEEIKDQITAQIRDEQRTAVVGGAGGHRSRGIYKIRLQGFKDVDFVYDTDELYGLGDVVSVMDDLEYDLDFDSLYEANKDNLLGHFIERVRQLDMDETKRKKVLYYGFNALYRTGEQP